MKPSVITLGTTPDHIIALENGGTDTLSNLQTLCDACHAIKTAEDLSHTKRFGCDASGNPTDPTHPWNNT